LSERQVFLIHDINFHRSIAAASGNPIVASLVEMVSLLYYERRRATAERAVDRDLRDAADSHRQIYQAVRARDVDAARRTMDEHLARSRSYQAKEAQGSTIKSSRLVHRSAPREGGLVHRSAPREGGLVHRSAPREGGQKRTAK
jgi:GntR family transcriptional repressor for pyruvate dehydrogenase complex